MLFAFSTQTITITPSTYKNVNAILFLFNRIFWYNVRELDVRRYSIFFFIDSFNIMYYVHVIFIQNKNETRIICTFFSDS